MQARTPSVASDAADAFGAPRPRLRRVSLVVVVVVVLARLLFFMFVSAPGRALLGFGSRYPSCAAAGISTPEGREGVCARDGGLFGSATVYNVVDRRHVLRMPEYEARVLGSRISSTRVPNASENPGLYPGGHGKLVSFEVMITNRSGGPLQFGSGVDSGLVPPYPRHPVVELALPSIGSASDISYPAIIHGRGAPTPSLFGQPPIAPQGSVMGWVTFVAPSWALRVLEVRPADIDFFRSDGSAGYIGQIRLWK